MHALKRQNMATLMESYEQQYSNLTAEIVSHTGKVPNLSGSKYMCIHSVSPDYTNNLFQTLWISECRFWGALSVSVSVSHTHRVTPTHSVRVTDSAQWLTDTLSESLTLTVRLSHTNSDSHSNSDTHWTVRLAKSLDRFNSIEFKMLPFHTL